MLPTKYYQALRVLLLADENDDARLIEDSLSAGGYALECAHIKSLTQLDSLLKNSGWDIAICYHQPEDNDLLKALCMVRERMPELPFLIVSDHIPDDIVICSMRAGAADFIARSQIAKLVVIVERELRLSESARARRCAEVSLSHLLYYDGLTGLPNSDHAHMELDNRIIAKPGQPLVVAIVAMQGLERSMRSFGPMVGNRQLIAATQKLNSLLPADGYLAYLNHGSFALVFAAKHCAHGLSQIEKICAEASVRLDIDGIAVRLSWVCGLALYPEHGADSSSLFAHAANALIAGEKQHQDVHIFDVADKISARHQMDLAHALRQAFTGGQFTLMYQPQLQLRKQQIIGAEALLRWQHPTRGMVSPAEFIPVLEETGLIIPVGAWVLKTACGAARNWLENGHQGLRVAVNLSAVQFQEPDLIDMVVATLTEYQLPVEALELEITESVAMTNLEQVIKTMSALRKLGVQLALDDFGTGFSSLGYLKKFAIDKLKIDQGFVRGITSNSVDRSVCRAVIDIGHSLNMCVIAEGVETKTQLAILKYLGCEQGQGYLFARPLVESAFINLLTEQKLCPARKPPARSTTARSRLSRPASFAHSSR